MTKPSPIEIFDSLQDLLHEFRTQTRSHVERLHPELTLNEMRVLMYTGRNAGLTQTEMIERSHTDKAQMARILASLEQQGLLERTASETDKRVRCLFLSEQGNALFKQLRDWQNQVGATLLKDLPEQMQRQMLNAFRQGGGKAD